VSKFWLWDFYWNNRETRRSPENYAAFVRKCAADSEMPRLRENAQQAGPYPEGPDNGWRYKFGRLPVHDRLLKACKLDEIAGQGDTFTRALRLMGWLCAHTWYSGASFWSARFSNSYFQGKRIDSMRILRFAFDKPFSHSINCGHVGYLLADCLLAAGFSAIPVTMKNYIYHAGGEKTKGVPNHTVVHLWLPEERRWVMLDPSLDSYISGSDGRALNLAEIYERRGGDDLRVARYSLNGTQECREEYLGYFILGSLLEIMVEDGACRDGSLRNRLLPGGVPLKGEKVRAITIAELLAEPILKE